MSGEETQDLQPTVGDHALETPPPAKELSGRFGRYDIERLLGRGGMGAVYLARQLDLDRPVVIKVIAPELAKDATVVARLQREARSAARISSDNVVQVHETGTEQGVPFIAMEYVDGSSAAAIVKERGPLPWEEATRIITAAARGLQAAHEVSVLHRDVKPANILVAKDGRVKVADFGLAKMELAERTLPAGQTDETKATLSTAGQILGTPAYMPPEQADGKTVDARSDIYALGVSYYELLTGTLPFRGETALKTLALVISATAKPPRDVIPSLPEAVDMTCLKLMARDPALRPKSAADAVLLLEKLAASSPSGRLPPRRAPSNPRIAVAGPVVVPASSGGGASSIVPGLVAAIVIVAVPAALYFALGKKAPPATVPVVAPAPTVTAPPTVSATEDDASPPPAPAATPSPAAPPAPGTESGGHPEIKVGPPPAIYDPASEPSAPPAPPGAPPPAAPKPRTAAPSPEKEAAAEGRFAEILKEGPKPFKWMALVEQYPGTKAAARAYDILRKNPNLEKFRSMNAEWMKQHDGGK
ncbi:MAG TPA: protein kinase [Planctomycetota bacterium]|nr:protein kinase [Planctomycetota bacterium]